MEPYLKIKDQHKKTFFFKSSELEKLVLLVLFFVFPYLMSPVLNRFFKTSSFKEDILFKLSHKNNTFNKLICNQSEPYFYHYLMERHCYYRIPKLYFAGMS